MCCRDLPSLCWVALHLLHRYDIFSTLYFFFHPLSFCTTLYLAFPPSVFLFHPLSCFNTLYLSVPPFILLFHHLFSIATLLPSAPSFSRITNAAKKIFVFQQSVYARGALNWFWMLYRKRRRKRRRKKRRKRRRSQSMKKWRSQKRKWRLQKRRLLRARSPWRPKAWFRSSPASLPTAYSSRMPSNVQIGCETGAGLSCVWIIAVSTKMASYQRI